MKRSRPKQRISSAAGAALALLAAPVGAAASPAVTGDASSKAAFLVKFPAYVEWPVAARPRPGAPIQLCLIGGDPFGPRIDRAASGRIVRGHRVRIRRLAFPGSASGCHIAFLQGDVAGALRQLRGRPVLTVTDSAAGMIRFVVRDGRLRFVIDQAEAARSGVTISSRLLGIALDVRPRP